MYQVVVRLPEIVSTLSNYADKNSKIVQDTFTSKFQVLIEIIYY